MLNRRHNLFVVGLPGGLFLVALDVIWPEKDLPPSLDKAAFGLAGKYRYDRSDHVISRNGYRACAGALGIAATQKAVI
jgi:hypothetical protein